jgi:hypothetical protein
VSGQPPALIGTAHLLKRAYAGENLLPLHLRLIEQLDANPNDPGTLMDLCALEQLLGDRPSGLSRQSAALSLQHIYRSSWPASAGALRVLAIAAPGDIGTNTPIEFLLQGGDTILTTLYLCRGQPIPTELPMHDIAIVTIGESDETTCTLRELARVTKAWPCQVLNDPGRVLDLSRERLQLVLTGLPGVVIPATRRVSRLELGRLAENPNRLGCLLPGADFPVIVRPVGSHAGRGLARVAASTDITPYLASNADVEFTISPYIDYRSADGRFRKYRIVWVDGVPHPCHMAICNDWKVWYLNADMAENAANRAEEATFMDDFAAGFARRHARALAAICGALGLHYVGMDCAEMPNGDLLVFEADISLIVHDMDPPEIFPYKLPCMRMLFADFQAMLKRQARKDVLF